jgi:spore coat protein A, manganese oxidase
VVTKAIAARPAWGTVDLDNGRRADILVRFDGFRGTYVFHGHNLGHEDMTVMANFEVV